MNDTFAFAVPAEQLAQMIGSEKAPHKLQVTYDGRTWELGDYTFTGAQVNGTDGTALIQLAKATVQATQE